LRYQILKERHYANGSDAIPTPKFTIRAKVGGAELVNEIG
jgi:hypothetical protein